jgi:hypothetical protein
MATVPWDTDIAKNVQKRSALYAKTGYGTPSLGTPANLEKTSVNTTMSEKGCTIAQAMPNAVCL